ncbi:hypothetical protein PENTCL1PPCAC_7394, partial [Pristionchus entomophagus]
FFSNFRMPFFSLFGKKKNKIGSLSKSQSDLTSIENVMPERHPSIVNGGPPRNFGVDNLNEAYRSSKGKKYRKPVMTAPVGTSSPLSSRTIDVRARRYDIDDGVLRSGHFQDTTDDSDEIDVQDDVHVQNRIREKIRQTEAERLTVLQKYNNLKLRRRNEKQQAYEELTAAYSRIGSLTMQNKALKRENEELKSEVERRRDYAMHSIQPSQGQYVSLNNTEYQQMQHECRELSALRQQLYPQQTGLFQQPFLPFPNYSIPTSFHTPQSLDQSRGQHRGGVARSVSGSDNFHPEYSTESDRSNTEAHHNHI